MHCKGSMLFSCPPKPRNPKARLLKLLDDSLLLVGHKSRTQSKWAATNTLHVNIKVLCYCIHMQLLPALHNLLWCSRFNSDLTTNRDALRRCSAFPEILYWSDLLEFKMAASGKYLSPKLYCKIQEDGITVMGFAKQLVPKTVVDLLHYYYTVAQVTRMKTVQ